MLFAFCSTNAQVSLVNNGYFEIYDTCPDYAAQITRAVGWISAKGSPDYYDSCPNINSANGINVPNTVFGYQQDCCGGNGYAGIYAFNKFFPNNGREYIQTKLNDTLKTGKKYLASMLVSSCNNYDYAIASLGMFFSSSPIHSTTNFIANAQVKSTTLLSDTLNWMLIQDTVVGTGSELYLTIGNFSYDSLSDTVKVYNMPNLYYAYYYIDGVSVYDLATVGIENIKKNEVGIKVYPNPNTGKEIFINTLGLDKGNVAVRITDMEGRLIVENNYTVENGLMNIRFADIKNGVYFVHITNTGSGEHIVKKLVIQY